MELNQPTTPSTPPPTYAPASAAPGIFGTKVPSTVAFVIGVLLFFMPFIDIKCNGTSLQTVSGFSLATGFTMKDNSSGNSLFDDMETDKEDGEKTKTTTSKADKKDPNLYAMIAMGLGVLGLALSFTNAKAAIGGAMVTGIACAGALIGLMLDVKKSIKTNIPGTGGGSTSTDDGGTGIGEGLDKIGKEMNDNLNITVDFTPWFYIAVLAFLAAAFFCYKRMSASKT